MTPATLKIIMTQITDKAAHTKMVKARISMLIKQPFFGTLALRLQLVEDTTLKPPTLAVDGRHLFYHPDWVNNNDFNTVEAGNAHEVGHCVFEHMSRRQGRTPYRWNCAGDYVINLVLRDAGYAIPAGWLISDAFAGMTTDQVYNALPPDDDDGSGPGSGPGPFDQVHDSQPLTSDEIADWKIETVNSANAAKAAGKLPGSLKRFIDEMLQGDTDWRPRLLRFATEKTKNDYSYQRVNRRFACMGIYLPGLYSEAMGTIAIVTDDSGSIDNAMLQAFASEIAAVRAAVAPQRTVIISCDARINHVDDLDEHSGFSMQCHGGGGTDFCPPFAWLEEQGIKPACLIYLTDLEGPFPAVAPDYPVLWCSTTSHIAPWGETLRVSV